MKIKFKARKKVIVVGVLVLAALSVLLYLFKNQIFADTNSGPYTIFQAENFAQVTWDTLPGTNKVLKEGSLISTFAAQGQTEDISFSVRPNQDLGEVQINLSDLKSGDKTIEKKNIEVLNLKVWSQCAPESASPNGNWIINCNNSSFKAPAYSEAIYRTTSKDLPELLVKNNKQDLVAAETAWGAPPEVDQSFQAELKAGKTHTFYLRIKVPEGASGGDYSGRITFAKKTGSTMSWEPTNLKLGLKVYPFRLTESGKEISTHVGYRIDDKFFQEGRQSIGIEKYAKYLDFLKASGFTTLIVNDYNNIDKVAKMMKERGFRKIIWRGLQYPSTQWTDSKIAAEIKVKIDQIKAAGFGENDVYLYGYDEPGAADTMLYNMEFAKFVHESGAKLATSMIKQVNDIASNQNAPLLTHTSTGLTVEEAKTDLPIYAGGASNTEFLSNYVGLYFDRAWSFPLVNDIPSFQAFPRGTTIGNSTGQYIKYSSPTANKYEKPLSKNVWHHVAGVFDGKTSQYRLYIDNEQSADFEFKYPNFEKGPNYNPIASPFGNKIPKNGQRTYIGAAIDSIKPLSTGKSRDGIVGFKGNIAGVKVYNQALTKAEIDQGTVHPRANYDFSEGGLADKTGHYPSCQITIKDGGELKFVNDNPVAGKKSLYFSGNRYGIANPTLNVAEVANSPHLDCGKIEDDYDIDDSMTVEFWVKLPNESTISNFNGSIISRLESYDRKFTKIEDYIIGMRKGTIAKDSNLTEFFYQQIWPEFGNLADRRGTSGFFLQSSGLDGFSPYGLDSPYKSEGSKYYDDFDAGEKTEFAVLPTASGDPLLTYQFEAFRAGVDDSRYFTVYNNLLADLKTKNPVKAARIEKVVNAMLDQYPYNLNGDGKSFAGKPNSFHQDNRKLVADKIVEMQKILGVVPSVVPSPTPTPSPSKTASTVTPSATPSTTYPSPTPTASAPTTSTPIPTYSTTATAATGITYEFKPGYSVIGVANNASFPATQLTNDTGLTVQGYNAYTKKWEISPKSKLSFIARLFGRSQPILNTMFSGSAYYVYNPYNSNKKVTVNAEANTSQVASQKLYKGGNFLFNGTQRDLRLSQIKVDVYDGNQCLAKNVTLDQLKDSAYIVKRPYIINDLTRMKTPTLQEASSAAGTITSIPAKKGYWIFVKNNITKITADSKFTSNRCN